MYAQAGRGIIATNKTKYSKHKLLPLSTASLNACFREAILNAGLNL